MAEKKAQPVSSKTSAIQFSTEIGSEMQVELSSIDNRIKLNLVGICEQDYLIYHMPEKIFKATGKDALKVDTPLNIRCISRGEAFGFRSIISSFIKTPINLLFIKYPVEIQRHNIRKNQRVNCLLPAKLSHETANIAGVVTDISRSGCHFKVKKVLLTAEQVALTQSGEQIDFAVSFPGHEGDKNISAAIKNTVIDPDKVQLGIEFVDVDEKTNSLIDDFIAMSFDLPPL